MNNQINDRSTTGYNKLQSNIGHNKMFETMVRQIHTRERADLQNAYNS